jgi:prepilin-type processing-associated H-X9-DG protein
MLASSTSTSRLSVLAFVSLLLGLASIVLLIITGIPAVILGYFSLRWINFSDGRLRGRGLAIAGMVLGGLGTVTAVVLLAARALADVREKAHSAECTENLHRLGLGLNLYDDDFKSFPPGTVPNDALPPERRLSWVALILPYMEPDAPPNDKATARRVSREKQVFRQIDFGRAWDDDGNRAAVETRLRFCICPSWSDPTARSFAWTSYVGIAGVGPDAASIPDFHPPLLVPKDPNAGMFGYDRATRRSDIIPGLTYTMMVVETTRDNGPWAQGGPATLRGIDPDDDPPVGYGRAFGGVHPGIVHVLYADGHVERINNTLPVAQWLEEARIRR